jgi:hypothetical protein
MRRDVCPPPPYGKHEKPHRPLTVLIVAMTTITSGEAGTLSASGRGQVDPGLAGMTIRVRIGATTRIF